MHEVSAAGNNGGVWTYVGLAWRERCAIQGRFSRVRLDHRQGLRIVQLRNSDDVSARSG